MTILLPAFPLHRDLLLPTPTTFPVLHLLCEFAEFEFAMTSHYTLPSKARAKFVQQNPFTTIRSKEWEPIFHLAALPVPWNQVPTSGTLFYLTGADFYTAWDAVFHLESGGLWTSIHYADYSGDLPPRVRPTSPN